MSVILSGDTAGIARAAALLRDGGIVAVPTETVYGLAARADKEEAVAAIYRAKGRPSFNPLIAHVANEAMARQVARFGSRAAQLSARFWPGPLTLVLPLRKEAEIVPAVTAGLGTIGVRMPDHPLMQAVLAQVGVPLAAPSANRSLSVSPTRADHVVQSLGERVDAILDGGSCTQGLESTIVALREDGSWNLLREGPITCAQLVEELGQEPVEASGAIEAPGQMQRHYSPGKPVRLNAKTAQAGEFHIGFGAIDGDSNLSPQGDLAQAAVRLYASLHEGAASAAPRIAIAPIPQEGIGAAINDRLRRAAS